jgi:hypothetical protein
MKTLLSWALAATIVFSAATLAGCKKDNPNNNQWGAETLTFKVNNSSDEFILKKVNLFLIVNQLMKLIVPVLLLNLNLIEKFLKIWKKVLLLIEFVKM